MLFQDKAKCIECHNGPLFSDESMHNIGVQKSPVFDREADAQVALRWQHHDRGVPETDYRAADRDQGLIFTPPSGMKTGASSGLRPCAISARQRPT